MRNSFLFIVFLFSLCGSSAFADRTQCSNATGDLRYADWNYDGGAVPAPGQVKGESSWIYQGILLGKETRYFGVPTTPSGLNVELTGRNQLALDQVSIPEGSEVYSVKVTLTKNDGPLAAPIDFILCRRIFDTIPKP